MRSHYKRTIIMAQLLLSSSSSSSAFSMLSIINKAPISSSSSFSRLGRKKTAAATTISTAMRNFGGCGFMPFPSKTDCNGCHGTSALNFKSFSRFNEENVSGLLIRNRQSSSSSNNKWKSLLDLYDDPLSSLSKPKSSDRISTRLKVRSKDDDSSSITGGENSWMTKNKQFDSTNDGGSRGGEKEKPMFNKQKLTKWKNESAAGSFQNSAKKNEYTGTRVFVQNIPTNIEWQELKDHFKIAGEVAFASISKDNIGRSKGCGIVQYETNEDAVNAIKTMRDNPLEGNSLYVREDVQDFAGSNASEKRPQQRGGDNRSPPKSEWKCANDDPSIYTEDETKPILDMIKSREIARYQRDYGKSDSMRETLKFRHSVHIDDRLKLWWFALDDAIPQKIKDIKGNDGGWDRKPRIQEPWKQILTNPAKDATVDSQTVLELLRRRDDARRRQHFELADELLAKAESCVDNDGENFNDLTVKIHDDSRTWRVWSQSFPVDKDYKSVLEPSFPHVRNKDPGTQCLELVKRCDPEKVEEIKSLLERFPGRENNILRKLRQKYRKPDPE